MKKIVFRFFCNLFSLLSEKAVFVFITYCMFTSFSVLAEMDNSSSVYAQNIALECICRDDSVKSNPFAPQVELIFSVMSVKGVDVESAMKKAQELCSSFGGNDLDCINISVEVECSCSADMGNGKLYSDRLIGVGVNDTEALKDVRFSCDEVVGEEASISQCIDLKDKDRKIVVSF
jgi:hypothetical protein